MNILEPWKVEINYPNSVFTGQVTYSTLFLSPVFGINLDGKISNYLVNMYLNDAQLEHLYLRPLFILLKTKEIDNDFVEIDNMLQKNRNFVYTYAVGEHEDEKLYMYVFNCPDEYIVDYDKFVNGEYSKFSSKLKAKFSRVIPAGTGYEESPLYGVLYKTPSFKKKVEKFLFNDPTEHLDNESEYFGKPDSKIEIFRYKIK